MMIETHDLTKIYTQKKVLDLRKTDLLFCSKKIHGILGANGSGKSTLMKIMAGLLLSSTGKIRYQGEDLNPSISKVITYSSHHPTLFSQSVYENIAYPLKIRKMPKEKIKKRVEKLMEEFEISKIKDQNAKKLSGGESQKTALARALSFSPKVLFLDEPTANIDPQTIKLMESGLLNRTQNDGLTVIIITHNLSQAFRICDSITFLNQGLCHYFGDAQNFIHSKDSVIQDFISINTVLPSKTFI